MIVENTFTSIPDLAGEILPLFSYFTCIQLFRFASVEKIHMLQNVPVLFVSGLQDEVVPPSHMKILFDRCGAKQKFLKRFREGRHMDTWTRKGYNETLRQFIIECLISQIRSTSSVVENTTQTQSQEQQPPYSEVMKSGMLVMDFVAKNQIFSQWSQTLPK